MPETLEDLVIKARQPGHGSRPVPGPNRPRQRQGRGWTGDRDAAMFWPRTRNRRWPACRPLVEWILRLLPKRAGRPRRIRNGPRSNSPPSPRTSSPQRSGGPSKTGVREAHILGPPPARHRSGGRYARGSPTDEAPTAHLARSRHPAGLRPVLPRREKVRASLRTALAAIDHHRPQYRAAAGAGESWRRPWRAAIRRDDHRGHITGLRKSPAGCDY